MQVLVQGAFVQGLEHVHTGVIEVETDHREQVLFDRHVLESADVFEEAFDDEVVDPFDMDEFAHDVLALHGGLVQSRQFSLLPCAHSLQQREIPPVQQQPFPFLVDLLRRQLDLRVLQLRLLSVQIRLGQ